jgi:hypothetical protein
MPKFWKEITVGVLTFLLISTLSFTGQRVMSLLKQIEKLNDTIKIHSIKLENTGSDLNKLLVKLATLEVNNRTLEIEIVKLKERTK